MNKTIQRPLACRNAHCGAMCSPAEADFFGSNPAKCFNYERRDDLYQNNNEILGKIRAEIEQIADEEQKHDEKWATGLRYALKIINKYMKNDGIIIINKEKQIHEDEV